MIQCIRVYFAVLATLLIAASTAYAHPADLAYFKDIQIDHNKVAGASGFANFTINISLTDADLANTSNGGYVQHNSGWDIIFTNADGSVVLDHQTECYDPATGKLAAWVKVPFLNALSSTNLRIYYGQTSSITDQSTTNAWDPNFEGIWHFSGNVNDASSTGLVLADNGSSDYPGVVGLARDFNGPQGAYGPVSPALSILGDLTLDTWVDLDVLHPGTFRNTLISFGGAGQGAAINYPYYLSVDGDGTIRLFWEFADGIHPNNEYEAITSTVPISNPLNTWYKVSVTRDTTSKTVRFYVNGTLLGTPVSYTNHPTGAWNSYLSLAEAHESPALNHLNGRLDETKISSTARSADWILTDFNSQSAPSSFFNTGPHQAAAPLSAPSSWPRYTTDSGDEFINDMVVDESDGSVYFVGKVNNASSALSGSLVFGSNDGFVSKLDKDGNLLWSFNVGGNGDDQCNGICIGDDGNIYVVGSLEGTADLSGMPPFVTAAITSKGQSDLFIASYTPAGQVRWAGTQGNSGVDEGISIASNSNGVFSLSSISDSNSATGGAVNALFNNGVVDIVIHSLDYAGSLQWAAYAGTPNDDDAPSDITADENQVYLIGTTDKNQMHWYNTDGSQANVSTTTQDKTVFVASYDVSGNYAWAHLLESPGGGVVHGNAIKVGCNGLFITGSTHDGTVFPGGLTLTSASNPHDMYYLAELDKANGNTEWVRGGDGGSVNHFNYGTALELTADGFLLFAGTFEGQIKLDNTTLTGTDKADLFLSKWTIDGDLEWAIKGTGADNDIPRAVAQDGKGQLFIAGKFEQDFAFDGSTISTGTANNFFVVDYGDPSFGGNATDADPSIWFRKVATCSSEAPIDLDSWLEPRYSGHADQITYQTGVFLTVLALGAPNGFGAVLETPGDSLVLDLSDTLFLGQNFRITWSNVLSSTLPANLLVYESADSLTWTLNPSNPSAPAGYNYQNSTFSASAGTRYLAIVYSSTTSASGFYIDGITYFAGTLLGGTWSGTNVSGGFFDPNGLSGPVPITYSVSADAGCTYLQTTRNVLVNDPPVGGNITGPLQACSPTDIDTLILINYTGTVHSWERSQDNFSTTPVIETNISDTLQITSITDTTWFRARLSTRGCGDAYSATFRILPDQAPQFKFCPNDTIIYVGNSCSSTFTIPALAYADVCDPSPTLRIDVTYDYLTVANKVDITGQTNVALALGAHMMSYELTDDAGYTSTCNQRVQVLDNAAPAITCVALDTLYMDSQCRVLLPLFDTIFSVSDNCGGTFTFDQSRGPGLTTSTTPGLVDMWFSATDQFGNSDTCKFQLELLDTIAPLIVCPPSETLTLAIGACQLSYTIPDPSSSSDNCGAVTGPTGRSVRDSNGDPVPIAIGASSTTTLSAGVYTIESVYSDLSGNQTTCVWTVTVQDTEAPSLVCSVSGQTVTGDASCTAVMPDILSTTTGSDCAVFIKTQRPAAGAIIQGDTTAYVILIDAWGNADSCAVSLSVQFPIVPLVCNTADTAVYVDALGQGLIPDLLHRALRTDCYSYSYSQTPAANTTFTPNQIVTVTATNTVTGATAQCQIGIFGLDTIDPVLSTTDTIIYLDANGQFVIDPSFVVLSATDNFSSVSVVLAQTDFDCSDLGTGAIGVTASDISGNTTTQSANITVLDTLAPTLNMPAAVTIQPLPHACEAIFSETVTASDNCTLLPNVQFVSGAANGSSLAPSTVGNPHYYAVYSASDDQGNTVIDSIEITVLPSPIGDVDYGATSFCQSLDSVVPVSFSYVHPNAIFIGTTGIDINSTTGVIYPANSTPGSYVIGYAIPGNPWACDGSWWDIIRIEAQPEAGKDSLTRICENSGQISLNQYLEFGTVAGGIWQDINSTGLLTQDSLVDVSGLANDTLYFNYQVSASSPCTNSNAALTLIVVEPNDAGADVAIDLCATDGVVQLNSFVNPGIAPGQWENVNTGTFVGNQLDLDSITAPANFLFRYHTAAIANCAADVSELSINVHAAANAGADAHQDLCVGSATFDMNTLLTNTTPGVWANGASNLYSPVTPGGPSTFYFISSETSCVDDSATITIYVDSTHWTGPGQTVPVCEGTIIDLTTLPHPTADPGTWSTGQTSYTAGTVNDTLYYIVSGGSCPASAASFIIDVDTLVYAGNDTSIDTCKGEVINLNNLLSGSFDLIGTWDVPQPYTANTSATVYYTVDGGNCPDDVAAITINVLDTVWAGNDTSIVVCSGTSVDLDLFRSQLGDPGGSFTGGQIQSFTTTSTVTYKVLGNGNCPDDESVITVSVVDPVFAGNDTTVTVCAGDLVDLDLLRSQLGDAGGIFSGGPFQTFTATTVVEYSISAVAPCVDDNSYITVLVDDLTDPLAVCKADTVYVDASGNATADPADLDNGSSDNCSSLTFSLSTTAFDCNDLGTPVPVVFTATDASGNTDDCQTNITVLDTIAPNANCASTNLQLDASGTAQLYAIDIYGSSSDNCSVVDSVVSPNSFTSVGNHTVWLVLTDQSGNQDSCSVIVVVSDPISPTALCQPLTVYLDALGNATINSIDLDNGSFDNGTIVSYLASDTVFDCSNLGPNTISLLVTDDAGNSSPCNSIVTVVDSISPAVVCQDITVYLNASGTANITASDIDAGSSDNCPAPSLALDITSFNCNDLGTPVTVTLSGTDGSGNMASCAATVTVLDTLNPVALCQNINVYLDASGNASITAADVDNGSTDNCGTPSISIDINNFDCSDLGTPVSVTLSATDGSSNTASCSATVSILDTIAPSATCQNITVYLDALGSATISASDVDNGSSDNCGTPSLAINITSFDCSDLGTPVNVTLSATDGSGNQSSCSVTVTVLDTIAPSVSCQDISVYLDASGTVSITANDIDNGSTNNCGTLSLGLDITSFDCSDIGNPVTVTLTGTDGSSNSASCTSSVTVLDTISPIVSCNSMNVYLDASGNATIAALDVDNGSSDNCGTPSLSIDISSFDCSDLGTPVSVTLTATDGSGNMAFCLATLTVLDTISPVVFCQNINVYLDASGVANIAASDLENSVSDNCGTPVLTTDINSFDCNDIGAPVAVTLTATDASGNQANCLATVTVLDTISPVMNCPSSAIVLYTPPSACLVQANYPSVLATDNCSSLVIEVTGPAIGDPIGLGTHPVQVLAIEANGDSTYCSFDLIVLDTIAPAISCIPDVVLAAPAGDCSAIAIFTEPTATDNCTNPVTWSKSHQPGDALPIGTTIVSYVATDLSGNSSTCVFTITVNDSVPLISYPSTPFCSVGGSASPNAAPYPVEGYFFADAGVVIDPLTGAVDLAATGPGVHSISYATTGACADTASTTITVQLQPNAGVSDAIDICSSETASFSLFDLLGTDAHLGGQWTFNSNTVDSIFDPGLDLGGTYTYSIAPIGPCSGDQATILVNIISAPDAGDFAFVPYCDSAGTVNLNVFLGAHDGNGTWSGPVDDISTGEYTPTVQGLFTFLYTVPGTAPCAADTASIYLDVKSDGYSGEDTTIRVCSSDPMLNLFDFLPGADLGGLWADPFSGSFGGIFDPNVNGQGDYIYTVNALFPCNASSTIVSVILEQQPAAGADSMATICNSNGAVSLSSLLSSNIQTNGSWYDPSQNLVASSLFDPLTDPVGMYTYVISGDSAICESDSAFWNISVAQQADPGANGTEDVCSAQGIVDLFQKLSGTPDPGGTWVDPFAQLHSGLLQADTASSGLYIYTVGGGFCPLVSATVQVNMTDSSDAGLPSAITLCQSSTPLDLFDALNGTPASNGYWYTDQSNFIQIGSGNALMFDPAIDTAGTYWYAVAGMQPCAAAWSNVQVEIPLSADAGVDDIVTVCSTNTPFDLFDMLGGSPQAGGIWTDANYAPTPNTFDPATGLSGVYTYNINLGPGCGIDSASVTVTLDQAPNAGTSNSVELCAGTTFFLLDSLLGTPQAGGSWSDPNGAPFGIEFLSTSAAGIYSYTVAGTGVCPDSVATLSISVKPSLSAGTFGDTAVCSNFGSLDLFDVLNGSPDLGGTWKEVSTGSNFAGIFDPQSNASGYYLYQVGGGNQCAIDTASVYVKRVDQVFTTDYVDFTKCVETNTYQLLAALPVNTPTNGLWINPNGYAGVYNEPFNVAIDTTGAYLYIVDNGDVCGADTVTVDVILYFPNLAGVDDSTTLCETIPMIELDSLLLGATYGNGSFWTDQNGTILTNDSLYPNPSYNSGTYMYHTLANGSCPADSASIYIEFTSTANAGNDAQLTICNTDAPLDMALLIGAHDVNGSWYESDGTGWAPMGSTTFDPQANSAGSYVFKYEIEDLVGGCVGDSAIVSISVEPANATGIRGADLEYCDSDPLEVDLFIGFDQVYDSTGIWYDLSGGYQLATSLVNTDSLAYGIYKYRYEVQTSLNCPAALDTITLIQYQYRSAGSNGSDTLCANDPQINLLSLLNGAAILGTWTDPFGGASTGTFDPSAGALGDYQYYISGLGACEADSAIVTIDVIPDAGVQTDTSLAICGQTTPIDLFDLFDGNMATGGSWQLQGPGWSFNGTFDPDTSTFGIYQYTALGCGGMVTSSVEVLHGVTPDPSWSRPGPFCTSDNAVDLNNFVTGTAGGTWSGIGVNAGNFDPSAVSSYSIVTYSVGSGNCAAALSDTLFVIAAPVANAGPDQEICDLNGYLNAISTTNGGSWTSTSGGVTFDDQSDPNSSVTVTAGGSYTFIWTNNNGVCTSSDAMNFDFYQPLDPTTVHAGPDQVLDIHGSTVLDANVVSQGVGTWSVLQGNAVFADMNDPATAVSDLQSGTNILLWTVTNGPCITLSDSLVITLNGLFIPTGFSPNGDMVNDVFEVRGIEGYPNAELIAFDRWGVKVFEKVGYNNEWDGRSMNGNELPADTYFVVLRLEDGHVYNGYVIIKR